jgi:hypothetical protein
VGKQQNQDHAAAVGAFVGQTLARVDALCDEWPSLPLEAVLTALDTMKNRILIARMASLVAEGTGIDMAEDEELDGDDAG